MYCPYCGKRDLVEVCFIFFRFENERHDDTAEVYYCSECSAVFADLSHKVKDLMGGI